MRLDRNIKKANTGTVKINTEKPEPLSLSFAVPARIATMNIPRTPRTIPALKQNFSVLKILTFIGDYNIACQITYGNSQKLERIMGRSP